MPILPIESTLRRDDLMIIIRLSLADILPYSLSYSFAPTAASKAPLIHFIDEPPSIYQWGFYLFIYFLSLNRSCECIRCVSESMVLYKRSAIQFYSATIDRVS